MKPPVEPNKEDCCNSGCNPCIFDVYEKQLKLYEMYIKNGKSSTSKETENALSQLEYTSFIVVQNTELCATHRLLDFKKMNDSTCKVWWKPGDHFLIKCVSEEMSCTRAYTPIDLECNTIRKIDFSIIVKTYENGQVSNYLANLKEGDVTQWRGPYGNYEMSLNKFDRIIMIAQGTGIAPLISIIQEILRNDDELTKLTLYYCCQNEDCIIFRDEIYKFSSYWNFTYSIFLSQSKTNIKCKYKEPIINRRLIKDDIMNLLPFSMKDQFLICGSTEFMKMYNDMIKERCTDLQNIVLF